MGHDGIVPLFCPTHQPKFAKDEIRACLRLRSKVRFELRRSTAESWAIARFAADLLDAAMAYRMDIVPFGSRVSTLHGVVFHFFARGAAQSRKEERGRRPRIDSALSPAA
jgi:hypothetical protein